MLRKLLKYEMKATRRVFFALYGAMFAAAVLMNISMYFPYINAFKVTTFFVMFALFVALAVLTLMTIVKRFKDNLFSDEGYLMFTIPVSTEKLILSKLISALIWTALSCIVTLLVIFTAFVNKEVISGIRDFFAYFNEMYAQILLYIGEIKGEHILAVVLFLLSIFSQYIYSVLLIYTSLSIGQTAIFSKRRGMASFGAFIGISIVASLLTRSVFGNLFGSITTFSLADIIAFNSIFGTAVLVNLSLSAILFYATNYILKYRLNIE
ncbi:MAG: hypothetical protein BWY15_01288 [Firmicutes bacterium ADurb.Bin193]|nr:MAG: hypothetical protein BWY15_01288 [Firmicutes bacterium ADurb.Bin193]